MTVSKKLQSTLWSMNTAKLDKKKDKYYIIHQIFAYGSMEEIRWVFKNYKKDNLVQIFKEFYKDYSVSRFYFIKNIVLGLKNWHPNENYYVKNTPRVIG